MKTQIRVVWRQLVVNIDSISKWGNMWRKDSNGESMECTNYIIYDVCGDDTKVTVANGQ